MLLIRNIDNDQRIGADWSISPMFRQVRQNPTGTFRSENAMDGVARLYAYQRIAYHPIVVSVGLSEAEILAPWWSKVKILAAVFSLMAISIVSSRLAVRLRTAPA